MAANCKYCFLCSYYDGYYVKGEYSFYKKSYGECRQKHGIVNINDSCENWKSNRERNANKQTKLRKLEKLAESLNELIIILKNNFENDIP